MNELLLRLYHRLPPTPQFLMIDMIGEAVRDGAATGAAAS
jgi:hypothetical protein